MIETPCRLHSASSSSPHHFNQQISFSLSSIERTSSESSSSSSSSSTSSSFDECALNECTTSSKDTNRSFFIEINDLESMLSNYDGDLYELLVILDCRLFKEFEQKHIKGSVHINCRDRITKNRLSSKKLSVRDIISCEKTKKKFDKYLPLLSNNNANKPIGERNINECNNDNGNLVIIIYDDATNRSDELDMQWNPIKIVLDNLMYSFKNSGVCKVLKGGFCEFLKRCPQLCVDENNDGKAANLIQLNNILVARLTYGEDQHRHSIESAKATKIDDHLYLGNEADARDLESLTNKGIFYILNVTKNIPFYHENNSLFKCKRIAVNDSCGENLKNYFDDAFKFIDEAKNSNSKVLVHCQAGVSRSPTIVIAYLMKKKRMKMQDAYNLVKEQRQIIDPNLVFMNQLDEFQSYLNEINKSHNSNNDATATTTSANNNNNCEFVNKEN